jgi:hypothetical protein
VAGAFGSVAHAAKGGAVFSTGLGEFLPALPPIAVLFAEGNEGGPGNTSDAQDRAALEPG